MKTETVLDEIINERQSQITRLDMPGNRFAPEVFCGMIDFFIRGAVFHINKGELKDARKALIGVAATAINLVEGLDRKASE